MATKSIRHGTAKDLSERADGFSANGESQFTRRSAASTNIKLGEGHRTSGHLLREMQVGLRKLRYQERNERDPIRLEKIRKNISIKSGFIATLKSQY
jgi:hypothetical protein